MIISNIGMGWWVMLIDLILTAVLFSVYLLLLWLVSRIVNRRRLHH